MLTFTLGEQKSLNMIVNAIGIDPSKLTYMFSIEVKDISYGFKCSYRLDKTSVTIPDLSKVIKDIKSGEYDARLDIFGEKYYMCPFDEKVKVVAPVKVDVSFTDGDKPGIDDTKKIETKVKIEEVETVKEEIVEEAPKKSSPFKDKFANFKKAES